MKKSYNLSIPIVLSSITPQSKRMFHP